MAAQPTWEVPLLSLLVASGFRMSWQRKIKVFLRQRKFPVLLPGCLRIEGLGPRGCQV